MALALNSIIFKEYHPKSWQMLNIPFCQRFLFLFPAISTSPRGFPLSFGPCHAAAAPSHLLQGCAPTPLLRNQDPWPPWIASIAVPLTDGWRTLGVVWMGIRGMKLMLSIPHDWCSQKNMLPSFEIIYSFWYWKQFHFTFPQWTADLALVIRASRKSNSSWSPSRRSSMSCRIPQPCTWGSLSLLVKSI